MAKVAMALLARSKQMMMKKKNPSLEHIAIKRAAGDMYATFDIVWQLCAFSSCSYLRRCCWHFSFCWHSYKQLTAVYWVVCHTHIHIYVCMCEHRHTHTVMYKGQHKSETGIVTKREFDLLRIRRRCQGHPATACGTAFPYILHLKGE